MDRRQFLKTTGGVAAVAASAVGAEAGERAQAPGAPAVAAGVRELVLTMPWADNGRGFGDSARRLARRIETLSQGSLRVVFAPEGASADADLIHDAAYMPTEPASIYFAGLPGATGLAPQDLAAWLDIGGGQGLWDDLAAGEERKPLLAGHTGVAPALWSRTPLLSLADLAGATISATGLGAEVARAMGGEATSLLPSELPRALADGRLSFVEWGSALQALALGLPSEAHYATGNGLSANGMALALSVKLARWRSLSEADQTLIKAAAAEEFMTSVAEARTHDAMIRSALAAAHGVTFAPFPVDVADAVSRVADALVAHVAGRDATAARIDHSYMAFKAAVAGTPVSARPVA